MVLLIVFLSFVLFLINYLVGRVLSHTEAGLFPYSSFSFADRDDNFSSNFFLKIINPTIFLAFVTGVVQQCNVFPLYSLQFLWWTVPGFWVFRFIYLKIINHLEIINMKYEIYSVIASLVLSYFIFNYFILKLINLGESVFISLTELRDAIWYAIFAYCSVAIWKILKTSFFNRHNIYTNSNRDVILMKKYQYFKMIYGSYIAFYMNKTKLSILKTYCYREFTLLIYAIMIYEDFNRPSNVRRIEKILKYIFPSKVKTIGIMQVRSTQIISDEKSIEIAINQLGKMYWKHLCDRENRIRYCINFYNSGEKYYDEVNSIFVRLKDISGEQ